MGDLFLNLHYNYLDEIVHYFVIMSFKLMFSEVCRLVSRMVKLLKAYYLDFSFFLGCYCSFFNFFLHNYCFWLQNVVCLLYLPKGVNIIVYLQHTSVFGGCYISIHLTEWGPALIQKAPWIDLKQSLVIFSFLQTYA